MPKDSATDTTTSHARRGGAASSCSATRSSGVVGVEQDECFTERLENALGDTDVINAGVPGYSTAQELLFYEREGAPIRLRPRDVGQ